MKLRVLSTARRRSAAAADRYVTHLAAARDYRALWIAVPLCAGLAWTLAHPIVGTAAVYAVLACLITLNLSHAQAWRSALSFVTAISLAMVTAAVARPLMGVNGLSIALVIAVGFTAAWLLGIGTAGAGFATVNSALIFTGTGTDLHTDIMRIAAVAFGAVLGIVGSRLLLSGADPVDAAERAVDAHARRLAALLDDIAGGIRTRDVSSGDRWLDEARAVDDAERVEGLLDAVRDEAKLGLIGPRERERVRALDARWAVLSTNTNRTRRMARSLRDIDGAAALPPEVADAVELAAQAVASGVSAGTAGQRDVIDDVAEELRDAPTRLMLAGAVVTSDAVLIADGYRRPA